MRPYYEPPSFGGLGPLDPRRDPLSLPALVANGTLGADTAALLWAAVRHRGSIVVAAGPMLAGKTTLLHAVTDLLPPGTEVVHARGAFEDFAFLGATEPRKTFILVNEISDHLPHYLWGQGVLRVLQCLEEGYALGATLHAESAREALKVLGFPGVEVPAGLVGHLALVATIAVGRGGGRPVRRVRELDLVAPTGPGERAPGLLPMGRWDPGAGALRAGGGEALGGLAAKLGLEPGALQGEVASLQALLEEVAVALPATRRDARDLLLRLAGEAQGHPPGA